MRKIRLGFASFRADRKAVTAIEYALMASLIGVIIVGAVTRTGSGVSGTFNTVSSELPSNIPAAWTPPVGSIPIGDGPNGAVNGYYSNGTMYNTQGQSVCSGGEIACMAVLGNS